jgi:hypothetical protein
MFTIPNWPTAAVIIIILLVLGTFISGMSRVLVEKEKTKQQNSLPYLKHEE